MSNSDTWFPKWGDIPAAEKAACLDLMVAYSGTYTVGEDRVTHHVNFDDSDYWCAVLILCGTHIDFLLR